MTTGKAARIVTQNAIVGGKTVDLLIPLTTVEQVAMEEHHRRSTAPLLINERCPIYAYRREGCFFPRQYPILQAQTCNRLDIGRYPDDTRDRCIGTPVGL